LTAAVGLLALTVSGAAAGTTWTLVPVPDISGAAPNLLSVSCAAPDNCITVGNVMPASGAPTFAISESWNGSAWTAASVAQPVHTNSDVLNSVSCVAADYCMAVGSFELTDKKHTTETLTELWDGSTWTIEEPNAVANIGLTSVSCASASFCAAQGDGVIEVWNGSMWSEAASVSRNNDLSVISCPTTAGCYVADGDRVAYWDGGTGLTRKSLATPAGGGNYGIDSITCPAAQSCTAVGYDNTAPLAEAWNGSAWAIEPTPAPAKTSASDLVSVSCVSTANCTAVGAKYPAQKENTEPLAERWNGSGHWGVANIPPPGDGDSNQFFADSCATTVNCMAVGLYTTTSGRDALAYVLQPTS
jgi:hypothetical protein